MTPTVLVTGGHGLLGSRLVPFLARKLPDSRIVVAARSDRHGNVEDPQVMAVHGDLRDGGFWAGLPSTITHVFHLAAIPPWRAQDTRGASVVTDNLMPLAHLVEHSQRWSGLRQIIYSSSVSVYAPTTEILREDSLKEPVSLYGASKLAGEVVLSTLEAHGVRAASLRLSSLYARGQYQGTVLPIMVRRALEQQGILIVGDGTRTQDFLHCDDAVRALWSCFTKEARGVFNIGSGASVTMTELARTVSRVFTGGKAAVDFQPSATNDPGIKLDIDKARRELDYRPEITLEAGLRKLKEEMELGGA